MEQHRHWDQCQCNRTQETPGWAHAHSFDHLSGYQSALLSLHTAAVDKGKAHLANNGNTALNRLLSKVFAAMALAANIK